MRRPSIWHPHARPDVDVMGPVGTDALGEPLPVPGGRFVRAGVLGRGGYVHVDADHLRVDVDGACARINTTPQKGRNLLANPKVSLLVVDPDSTARFIQIRGDAELVTDGALEHLDALTRRYTPHPAYYGYVYPLAQQLRETRVICRIHARRITLNAVHA